MYIAFIACCVYVYVDSYGKELYIFGVCTAIMLIVELNFRDLCLVILDDIIVFSKTLEEHTRRLELLFELLRLANLKLQPPSAT